MDSATPSGDGTGIAEPSARKGFWSFVSDDESVERGQVNFWAIAETLLAIGVFWYVALEWETFFLLYTSLFIAPLLFLRSEKSVEHGVIWLSEGSFPAKKMSESRVVLEWFEAREKERRTRWLAAGIGIAVGVGVSVALGYLMAKAFLVGYEGWAGFWRGLVLGYFFIAIVGTLVVAVHITLTGTAGITTRSAQAVALVVAGFEALAGMVAGAGAGALGAALSVALFIPLVLLLRRAILDEFMLGCMPGQIPVFGHYPVFDQLFVGPTFVLGVWIATLLVRFFATFRYAIDGYAAMPANIRRLSLLTAPGHVPELLPGLPKEHPFRFGAVITEMKQGAIFFWLPLLAFWFIPGWAYRFILKSTLWFWWVLFIIGGAPNVKDGIEGLRADAYRKSFSWVLIALAVFGVVSFLFGSALKPIIVNRLSGAPLPTAVALLMLIDWRALSFFQGLSALSSVMTLWVAFWAHGLSVDYREVPGRKEEVEKRLPWLGHLIKWKTGVGMVSIALLMLYIALYANIAEHWAPVSDWAFGWLELLYGENAKALLPQS